MRITFLLTQSLERPSGLGRYWPMARVLAAQGHQVKILALHPRWSKLITRQFVCEKVLVHYVGPMHIQQTTLGKTYYGFGRLLAIVLFSTFTLTWHALKTPCDLVIVGKAQPMNGTAGLLTHWLRRVRLWLDCDDYEAGSNRFSNHWQRSLVAWFEDYLPKHAERISVNTQFMYKHILALGISARRICWIPNGVERERFAHIDALEFERLRYQLAIGDRRCVLYVGSLSLTNHAVDLLIDAFTLIARDCQDTILMIVGDGEDAEVLHAQISQLGITDRVRLIGRVPPERVPLYYHLANVSIDPVREDDASRARSPLKLFESWAAGIPFVTGDVGDRHILLTDGLNGILVTPGDPTALAKGIERVLQDKFLAETLWQNGLVAIEKFWWDVLIQNWVESCLDR